MSHAESCEPSNHCGAPIDHATHPLLSGRPCTGQACPITSTLMAEANRKLDEAAALVEATAAERFEKHTTDLGVTETLALEQVARILRSEATDTGVLVLAAKIVLRAVGR